MAQVRLPQLKELLAAVSSHWGYEDPIYRFYHLHLTSNDKNMYILYMSNKTSMNIPKELLDEAVQVSGATTKTMAVVLGLEELIHRKRLEALLKLQGSGRLKLSKRQLHFMRRR